VPAIERAWVTTRKKIVHATERDTARVRMARRRYRKQMTKFPVDRLRFVDESGLNIAMSGSWGKINLPAAIFPGLVTD
jgi:hypothetical protein